MEDFIMTDDLRAKIMEETRVFDTGVKDTAYSSEEYLSFSFNALRSSESEWLAFRGRTELPYHLKRLRIVLETKKECIKQLRKEQIKTIMDRRSK